MTGHSAPSGQLRPEWAGIPDHSGNNRPLGQWTPSRADLVDAGLLFVLALIALVELRSTFEGATFLVVGLVGVLLGIAITYVANVLNLPAIVAVAGGVIAYFLLGGLIAAHGAPGASVLPTGGTLRALGHAVIHGWRDLLTTVPPVDGSGALVILPFLLGLATGLAGFAVARRTKGALWPALVPLLLLAVVILIGTLDPKSVALPATLFAVGVLIWASVRHQRLRPTVASGSDARTRAAIAAVLLAASGAAAYALGPHVPGSHSQDRVALRRYIVPPSNIGNYPSPLSEYREYVGHQTDGNGHVTSLADKTLFTVSGTVPAGTAIRFGTMDTYNGLVWTATDQPRSVGGVPDAFLKVGSRLDNPAKGPAYTMNVKIGSYDDYWMPSAGAVQGVDFTDDTATQQTTDFRYDLATQTGVVPGKLRSGDAYTLRVAGVTPPKLTANDDLASDGYDSNGDFLSETTKHLAGDADSTTAQVLKIAQQLKATGRYTHGDPGSGFAYYLPGHSVGRLAKFANGVEKGFPPFVGDDEQYAAAYAVMIEQLGVPARVVVGVPALPKGGVVKGSDVAAWVEVRSVDGPWLQIPREQFISNKPPDKNVLQQKEKQNPGSDVPPPAQGLPKTALDDQAQAEGSSNELTKKHDEAAGGLHVPAWLIALGIYGGLPLLGIACILGAIVAAKVWRRSRRRTRGDPSTRLARGWREVVDHARDLGTVMPLRSTRREQARTVAGADLVPLARLADAHVFGGGEITEEHAGSFWSEVVAARKHMSASVGRRRRFLAAINPVTFLPRLPGVDS